MQRNFDKVQRNRTREGCDRVQSRALKVQARACRSQARLPWPAARAALGVSQQTDTMPPQLPSRFNAEFTKNKLYAANQHKNPSII